MFFYSFIIYLLVIFVIAGFIYLKVDRDDISFYGHIFQWWISPVIIIAGIIFIDKQAKRYYFKRMKSNLFINK